MTNDDIVKIKLFEQAVIKSWTDIYPLQDSYVKQQNTNKAFNVDDFLFNKEG